MATLSLSLLAVSPTHLSHAQNAMPRSLWIFFPYLLGIQRAIAYLLGTKTTVAASTAHPRLWRVMTITSLSLGVLSCAIMSPGASWKGVGSFERDAAALIN